jgi:hypothetical protein
MKPQICSGSEVLSRDRKTIQKEREKKGTESE